MPGQTLPEILPERSFVQFPPLVLSYAVMLFTTKVLSK